MDRTRCDVSRRKLFGVVPLLVALLLPLAPLSAQECEIAPYEPLVLRGQRIPFYEVFDTFLLQASIVYDSQGEAGFRAFLREYGLDPQMESLQSLPWAFDDVQSAIQTKRGGVEHETARLLGQILARISADLEANDPRGIAAARDFRLKLGTKLRPQMGVSFMDGSPDFAVMDESEEAFNASLNGSGNGGVEGEALDDGVGPIHVVHGESEAPSATRVKLSYLERRDGSALAMKHSGSPDLVEVTLRSYARADGRTRVIGLFLGEEGPAGLVDITFGPGHPVRDELEPKGPGGFRRYAESFVVDDGLAGKSHTSLGCIAAEVTVGLACATCYVEPTKLSCPACFAAILAAAAACNQPHCVQIECNDSCVQACHLYGVCSDTSGSSSPLDCQCYGIRNDIPGCGSDGCTEFLSIAVVRERGITVDKMNAREAAVRQAITARSGLDATIAGWGAGGGLSWSQYGPNAIVAKTCDDGGGSGGGGGGGGGGSGGGSGGGETCTHCSCEGEHTSWEGEVCGGSVDELVDECWNSCW